MEIKDIIKKKREELNLTYEQLGNMVGVGKSTVRKWETGMIENMRRDNIIALAKALNISPVDIMGWSDETEDHKNDLKNLKIENDLKQIILNKYSNIEDFCTKNNILHSKIDKIFKKGIDSADIQLIFKICSVLDIDVNSIVDGEIHFNNELLKYNKIPSVLSKDESALLVNYNKLNNLGKDKLIEYSNDLTETPKYIENTINNNTNDLITATKVEYRNSCDNIPKLEVAERKESYVPTTLAAHAKDNQNDEANKRDIEKIKALMAKNKKF